jgi:hypothetical protein
MINFILIVGRFCRILTPYVVVKTYLVVAFLCVVATFSCVLGAKSRVWGVFFIIWIELLTWWSILSLLSYFHCLYLLWDEFITESALLPLFYNGTSSFLGRVLVG